MKKLGFEVQLGLDLDQKSFASTIEDFARALDGADVGLFFYAGHGLQLNDKNYLVSVNARLENEFLLAAETMDLTAIVRLMESKAAVNLVFLDACRNNPLAENLRRGLEATKRSAALGRGLARVEPTSRDTLIAFAAAPGQVAADGNDRNSPFTASLLRNIPRPKVEVSVMLKEVSADVRRATANAQRPQQLSDMSRTFYFAAEPAVAEASAPAPAPKAPAAPAGDDRALDVAFWSAAQSANDCESTRVYLQRFPNGAFVDLARLAERRLCLPSRQVTVVEQATPAPSLTPAAPPAPAIPPFVPPETVTETPPSAPVVAALPEPAAAPVEAPAAEADTDLARNIQQELVRLGCQSGDPDGNWGKATRAAIGRFNRHARASLDSAKPTADLMSALQTMRSGSVRWRARAGRAHRVTTAWRSNVRAAATSPSALRHGRRRPRSGGRPHSLRRPRRRASPSGRRNRSSPARCASRASRTPAANGAAPTIRRAGRRSSSVPEQGHTGRVKELERDEASRSDVRLGDPIARGVCSAHIPEKWIPVFRKDISRGTHWRCGGPADRPIPDSGPSASANTSHGHGSNRPRRR